MSKKLQAFYLLFMIICGAVFIIFPRHSYLYVGSDTTTDFTHDLCMGSYLPANFVPQPLKVHPQGIPVINRVSYTGGYYCYPQDSMSNKSLKASVDFLSGMIVGGVIVFIFRKSRLRAKA